VEHSPLVHGSGRALMGPAFDVILETYKEEEDGKIKYYYRCEGSSSKHTLKSRGWPLEPVMEADPVKVWSILTRKEAK